MKVNLEGWVQTDGSAETLQYGRKLSETSWEYMEWVDDHLSKDNPTTEQKLADLSSKNWRVAEIDLKDYTKEEIAEAIDSFGYEISFWQSQEVFNIEQSGYTYSVEDSVQLSCECIFEQEF